MANSYTQVYIQYVFVVRGRASLILPSFEQVLYKYMTGIVKSLDQHLLAINGMPDHVHLLVRLRPTMSVSELAGKVKSNASRFINAEGDLNTRFEWQTGFGAFSYHQSMVPRIVQYIQNQKIHHQKRKLREEYLALLREYQVDFDPQYLPDWIED